MKTLMIGFIAIVLLGGFGFGYGYDRIGNTYILVFEGNDGHGKQIEFKIDTHQNEIISFPDGDETGTSKVLGHWEISDSSIIFRVDSIICVGKFNSLNIITGTLEWRGIIRQFHAYPKYLWEQINK